MKQHEKARKWRNERRLTVEKLSELSGWSIEAIYLFERGVTPKGEPVSDWVWQRYRMVCAGIDAELRSGVRFDWGN